MTAARLIRQSHRWLSILFTLGNGQRHIDLAIRRHHVDDAGLKALAIHDRADGQGRLSGEDVVEVAQPIGVEVLSDDNIWDAVRDTSQIK